MAEQTYQRKYIEYEDKVRKGTEGAHVGTNDTFRAVDANEIKEVVNHNADMLQVAYNDLGEIYNETFPVKIDLGQSLTRVQKIVAAGTSMTNILRWQVSSKGQALALTRNDLYCDGALLLSDIDKRMYVHQFTGLTRPGKKSYNLQIKCINDFGERESAKSAELVFVAPSYFGIVNTLTPTVAQIQLLDELLLETKAYTRADVSYVAARVCYAYPAMNGNLAAILDQNNFNYITSFTKSTCQIDGIEYNVYVLTNPVTVSKSTYIFK